MASSETQFLTDTGFNLREGEEILFAAKPSPNTKLYFFFSRMSRWGFLGTFFVVYLALHVLFMPHYLDTLAPYAQFFAKFSAIQWLSAGVVLAGLLFAYYSKLVASCIYYVTNQRCILKTGFFSQQTRVIPYSQVNDINVQTTALGKLFGLQSVCIESLGTIAASNRNRRNNATRMDGLTPEVSGQVMDAISKQLLSNNRH